MNRYCLIILAMLGGSPPASAYAQLQHFPFQGTFNVAQQSLSVQLLVSPDSSVSLHAQKAGETSFDVKLNISHLETPLFNFSSEIESVVDILKAEDGSFKELSGKLSSQFSLVDFHPIGDLQGRFQFINRRLILDSVVFGRVALNGYIDLFYPFNLDLAVGLNEIGMNDFLDCFYRSRTFQSDGLVSGDVKLSGSLSRLALKGSLVGEKGFVKDLAFETLNINFDGIYPHIDLDQSKLVKDDGFIFSINGAVDLVDFKYFKKQIEGLVLAPIVSDSGEERLWTIKEEDEEGSRMKTELKSILRDKNVNPEQQDKSGMLGIQKTMEF